MTTIPAVRGSIEAVLTLLQDQIEQVAVEVGAYTPFRTYASYLMSRNLLSPAEALVTVA